MAPVQASLSYGTVHVFGSHLSFIWTFTRLVTLRFRCCHSRWSTMTLFVAKNFIFFLTYDFMAGNMGTAVGHKKRERIAEGRAELD